MKYEWLVSAAAVAIGLVGIGYAFGQRKKLDDISEKLDKSIDELSESTTVDVPASMIQKAAERAVDREVAFVVPRAVDTAVKVIKDDISAQVRTSIDAVYTDVGKDVKAELDRQVAKLDIDKLKREVIAAAKEDAADKLEGSLDDILENFNRNLKNLSSVYQSMAETMSSSGKKVELSLG